MPAGPLLRVGAVVEGLAIVGFAATFTWLFHESDRARVGFYGVLAGALTGLLAVALAIHLAVVGASAGVVVAYQFYPPGIGRFSLADNRAALATVAGIGGGLLLSAGGLVTRRAAVVVAGEVATLAGAVGFAYLLVGIFIQRALE